MTAKFWTEKHYGAAAKARNLSELLSVAYEILDSMPAPVSLVSGPITTGGRGSVAENLKIMEETIRSLESSGEHIFNQIPFETKVAELASRHDGYFMPVLEEFFLPIFKSGKIAKIFFMSGWDSSTGARWEYEQAGKLGIERASLSACDPETPTS